MAVLKLTKRAIDALPAPASGDAYYWDSDLKGFGLRVTARGVKSYVVQYRMKQQPAQRLTVGQHGSPWTAEKARAHAETILMDVKRDINPVQAAKRRARESVDLMFDRYIETFTEGHLKGAWPDTWAQAKRQLEMYALPILKGRPLPQIEKHETAAVIAPLRSKVALARNVHAVLRKLFAWAVDQGDLKESPICAAPPSAKARKRVLTPDELLAAWRASYKLSDPFGPWLRVVIATLQRRDEVAGLPWAELSHPNLLWRLDGDRAKNDTDHLVPLNALAAAEFEALGWRRKGLVFSTTGATPISGFSKAKRKLDALMLPILQEIADEQADALGEPRETVTLAPWRLHDIRRTGTTQMQALGVPIEVTEKVINHLSGETAGIRGVYNLHQYSAEKREALDQWGSYLERLISSDRSKVIALAARRA